MSSAPSDKNSPSSPNGHPHHLNRLSFLSQVSPEYIEALEKLYEQDPKAVPSEWAFFFDVLRLGQGEPRFIPSLAEGSSEVADEIQVSNLINAYRMRGHLLAKLDPLGLYQPPFRPYLDLQYFKLDKVSPDRTFQVATEIGLPPLSILTDIVKHLQETYCRTVGVEFFYIRDEKINKWLSQRLDQNQNKTHFTAPQKIKILQSLHRTSIFENFLQNNYTGQKRFSLEGSESLIPALKQAIEVCADQGAAEVVIGMAHRGRLNVLANVMNKPYQEIFKEFEGAELPQMEEVMGDVKYHQGYSTDIQTDGGKSVHLSLAPNPSHLEFVDPVVEGVTRAKQEAKYQGDPNKVVPILVHGDAAVIGQGVVAETLNLSLLNGYKTGGTIHVVINNQIGFTTLPGDARSSLYCTDFGKAFQCPMIHVNGDEVEDVVHAIIMASEYRMKFHRDVFVDIWCYRKYGHNEGDEPRFTQPTMYSIISKHKSPLDLYIEKLTAEPDVDQKVIDQFSLNFQKELSEKRAETQKGSRILLADMFRGLWAGFERPNEIRLTESVDTQIQSSHFEKVISALHTIPPHIKPLAKFEKMLETRYKKIKEENEIDWAVGEQLGWGSLLLEGSHVRVSGQDSVRGTFSQRHASMTDNQTSERHIPLQHLAENQAIFSIYDSPLSEAAVLGFDYGYSVANPKTLVCWEAQFGDFANGAQVIIDQFISSAEAKWYRMSGITLLLPHGFEGQGPEHSSARLERFLQLCAQNNMQVTYPSTPAQYCHLLRRQMFRKFRKPLIVMTPKSMLRMPEVVSKTEDFIAGRFQCILLDEPSSAQPERVVLCTGKIYWELRRKALEMQILEKIVFIRLEQIYPLDKMKLKELHVKWGQRPWIWAQEEPKNMGAWNFVRMNTMELGIEISYAGRVPAASPATGSALTHAREQEALILEALGLKKS